jgi:hypothetical protein
MIFFAVHRSIFPAGALEQGTGLRPPLTAVITDNRLFLLGFLTR